MPSATTLREIRRSISPRTGFFLAGTATSGTVSSLIDAKYPLRSGNIQDDLLVGKWILRPDAAQESDLVRVVSENGYLPATGTIQPDLDWSAPPVAGEVYEIHSAVEPWSEVNSIINDALLRCYLVAEVPIAPTAAATRHGLNTAAPWLQAAQHVRRFGYLLSGESRNGHDPYRHRFFWEAVDDQGTVYVEHAPKTFDNGEVLYAQALMPAYHSCRDDSSGVWGERAGLASDDNQAPVEREWLLAAAMIEYWERVAGQLPDDDDDTGRALERQARWAAIFDTMSAKYLRLPPRNNHDRITVTGLNARY
jgi:hypothetical protein